MKFYLKDTKLFTNFVDNLLEEVWLVIAKLGINPCWLDSYFILFKTAIIKHHLK